MPELSGIYDAAPIQPICKIKENITALSGGVWEHFRVEYIEPIPRSSQTIVDMVAAAGATSIAAAGTIAKRIVAVLQLKDTEMLHLRWEPLENVEGVLWEQSGTSRFQTRNIQARVSKITKLYDPYLASTTFWVVGHNRDMNLEVRNPLAVALPMARFIFWGFRMVIAAWTDLKTFTTDQKLKLSEGDVDTVRSLIGVTTWLPAEGSAV